MTPMLHVKITHAGRPLQDVENDCKAAGLISDGATYEPGYPLYGRIDSTKVDALRAVPGVLNVATWTSPTGDTPYDGTPRL